MTATLSINNTSSIAPTEKLLCELQDQNTRLAGVSAEAAELVAEVEEKNDKLDQANKHLARANVWAAELMAELELKDQRIRTLNQALSKTNAESAELMAEIDSQNSELQRLNGRMRQTNLELEETNDRLLKSQKELQEKTNTLLQAERHRVMIQSLGAACHHLGQPAANLTMLLFLMKEQAKTTEEIQEIELGMQEVEVISTVLKKLREVTEFRTEPYVGGENPEETCILAI